MSLPRSTGPPDTLTVALGEAVARSLPTGRAELEAIVVETSGKVEVVRITELSSTYCFVSYKGRPAQVARIIIEGAPARAEVTVSLEGAGFEVPEPWKGKLEPSRAGQRGGPAWAPAEDPGLAQAGRFSPRAASPEGVVVEVPVLVGANHSPGEHLAAVATAKSGSSTAQRKGELVVRETGWRMIMVPHFHYDPVWWNTQAGYTSGWDELLWASERRETFQHTGLVLVEAHLERARLDPRYKFVLAEVDYLKPFWDLYPDRRDEIRALLRAGRLEIVGGTYNEPNTNLTGAETAIRAAVYGFGFQRDVVGADPRTAWQLDVFGHDPQFPGIMAGCGVSSSAWARGPFHQWGPLRETGSNSWMQFPSEFEWVAPNGLGLLTSYMPNHYSAGWDLESATTLEGAMWRAYELFGDLAEVAATRVTLLPVGTDYTPPSRFVGDLSDTWNDRYLWPRFEVGLPREFFAAVREELSSQGRRPSPQTRDMGPVYTGKDVSFIDTKQAQRLAESTVADAEALVAIGAALSAALPHRPSDAASPHRALDKAWRQLVFGAHHDGITGSESDQVYLDLLAGWREAYELARGVEEDAREFLLSQVDTSGEGEAIVVTNTLGQSRSGMAKAEIPKQRPGEGYDVRDEAGERRDVLVEEANKPGHLQLTFRSEDVPGLGYRTFRLLRRGRDGEDRGWSEAPGTEISNDLLEIVADPGQGGGLGHIRDLTTGFDLLPPDEVANELLVYPEHPTHPRFGEGPWNLLPKGPPARSRSRTARVRKEVSPLGERLVVDGSLAYGDAGSDGGKEGFSYRQVVTLWGGSRRAELRTELHDWVARDKLVRLRFPTSLAGATPVSAVGDAVIARGFALIDADAAEAPWALDNPAAEWFGLSTTFLLEASEPPGESASVYHRRSVGVAEVVTGPGESSAPWARDLVVALVQKGVTSTCSEAGRNRYGGLLGDSNLPDFRIAIGVPEHNPYVADLLAAAGAGFSEELQRQLSQQNWARLLVPPERPLAEVWRPNADLRGTRDLPVLIVAAEGPRAIASAVAHLVAEVTMGRARVVQPAHLLAGRAEDVPEWTAAILNRGTPSFAVDCEGAMHVSVLRSCSGWPSGVWIDPPRRTTPDGSAFELEHWSHVFEHALMFGRGDWREVGCVNEALDYNRPLRASVVAPHEGALPKSARLLGLSKRGGAGEVALAALKPAGNPLAKADPFDPRDDLAGLTVRCYEHAGSSAEVELESRFALESAERSNLLEEPGEHLIVRGGGRGTGGSAVRFSLHAGELATVRLGLAKPDGPGGGATGGEPGPRPEWRPGGNVEVAQPVFSRYWLHNKGAAPMGNQALAVHFRSTSAVVRAGWTGEIVAQVASGASEAAQSGRLDIVAPEGWSVSPSSRLFSLAPAAYLAIPVRFEVPGRTYPGRRFLSARIVDEAGQVQEDVLTVDVVPSLEEALPGKREPAASPARNGDRLFAMPPAFGHPSSQFLDEMEATVSPGELALPPGASATVTLRLANRTAGELRGEVQVLSPVETWPWVGPWDQAFAIPPGQAHEFGATVVAPVRDWLSSWALFKVTYFGRLWYSPTVRLSLGERPPVGAREAAQAGQLASHA